MYEYSRNVETHPLKIKRVKNLFLWKEFDDEKQIFANFCYTVMILRVAS